VSSISSLDCCRVDENSVYNLKRKIAALPPISFKVFDTQVLASESGSEDERWEAHAKAKNHVMRSDELESLAPEDFASLSPLSSNEEEYFDPAQCLFCNLDSPSMQDNLKHMSEVHTFIIPSADHLTDVSSLLHYLHILVYVFHECLFCHKERNTKAGAQDHMRGKGHCKLDLDDEESELWEFYDFGSEGREKGDVEIRDGVVKIEDSLRLPSGKVLGHRTQPRSSQRHPSTRRRSKSPQQHLLTESGDEAEISTDTTESKDQRVVLRKGAEMSLAGISGLQQRALMVMERQREGLQARVRNEYQGSLERGANRQKRFRVKHMGKKRGGLEKRLG
jgi:pre-60S factor REI1